ncbi:MAG: hypothetical protein EDQ89_00990 [Acidobacteria bacterium]|nr:MAG: hypothetical protein EDQ89_00990 [Acidobacteriota bacterium]MCL4288091.1 hypothetical protein [Thermoleophilia bacterium]
MRASGGRADPGAAPGPLHLRPLLRQVADGYRHNWRLLLGTGLILFGVIGLVSALDPFDTEAVDGWDGSAIAGLVLLITAQVSIPLLGDVFYSGVAAAGEQRRRHGAGHGIVAVARSLPYRTLILADLLLFALVAAGLVVLIVPGFIVATWFALIAPLIEIEGLGVRAAFRRSRTLVRPYFWRVAGVVVPLAFLQATLEAAGDSLGHSLLGEGYLGNWLAEVAANLLASPLYALTVLALYFELTAREERAAGRRPRGRDPGPEGG